MKIFFTISKIRYLSIIIINLFFVLSFKADIQILEGSLTGSRIIGFHLIDPFIAIEQLAIQHYLPVNIIIGTVTIILFYFFVGGRLFCSWVCPYGLLSEIGELVHKVLIRKKIIKKRYELGNTKYFFLILFLISAVVTGYLFFDIINLMSITSRLIIYGFTLSSLLILFMLIVEIFFSRRVYCRSICPIGATYGLLNKISAGRLEWNNSCVHCNKCKSVCIEPKILEVISSKDNSEKERVVIRSTDCTLCFKCVEICDTKSIAYKNNIKNLV